MAHAEVTYYLENDTQRVLEVLRDQGSPLKLSKSHDYDMHEFQSKDRALYAAFILGDVDSEGIESPPHTTLSSILEFTPKSNLHYSLGEPTEEKAQAFFRIAHYLQERDTAFYIILDEPTGEPHTIYGHNPRTGTTVGRLAFERSLRPGSLDNELE